MGSTRRQFLRSTARAGAALVVGLHLPGCRRAAHPDDGGPSAPGSFEPNAWVRVEADGTVRLLLPKSEMGQGALTGLAMLVAEELEVELADVRAESAPADPRYAYEGGPPVLFTGGSTSVRLSWEPLRRAGATARVALVGAAAAAWSVDASSCRAERGAVLHVPSGRRLGYGALTARAAALGAPADAPLKAPDEHRLIGRPLARLDTPSKVDGSARFGLDVQRPGLLVATIERCPVRGGRLLSVDDALARKVPGVRHVVPLEAGVAVVADGFWAALKGRRALRPTWHEGADADVDSGAISAALERGARDRGASIRADGDAATALGRTARRVSATYEVPFLAHAPMEPPNCTAEVQGDRCEVWAPTQVPSAAREAAARAAGLRPEQVTLHTTLLGGGFGRRLETDDVSEAVQLAKAVAAPIKLVWTREDELRNGFYRPVSYTRLEAGLDHEGWPVALRQRIVSPSIRARTRAGGDARRDPSSTEGSAADMPYAIPHVEVDYVVADARVPVGYWRSVGHSQNAFFLESFLDEVAAAGGKDPVELRRRLLASSPRPRAVLELAAERAGWGGACAPGRGRGVALHASFGSVVAQIAEVSADVGAAQVRIHRVVCAIDCGRAVNPRLIEMQLESSIAFGLSAALRGAITLARGRVVQSNFHDYPLLRLREMPRVEVHVVASEAPPSGVGEPGVPPIAPAVANALFAATGRRIRRLPIEAALRT